MKHRIWARLCRVGRTSPIQISAGLWYLSVGTKDWHNYVSLGGVSGLLQIVVKHFQFCSGFAWMPHWPRFYDGPRIFRRALGSKRWTDHAVGISFWPVSFGVYWHTTCYGCSAEYSRDLTAHDERRRVEALHV